jgi:hypothetical protein
MKWSYIPAIIFIFTIVAISVDIKRWREAIPLGIYGGIILGFIYLVAPQALPPALGLISVAYCITRD